MDHNMDDTDVMDVCLIGHSFVTRLHRYMQSSGRLQNLNLDVDKFRISVCARGGLRVAQLSSTNFLNFASVPRRDGVHLQNPHPSVHHAVSSSPMHRYWRSVRPAILHYRKNFRPVY